MRFQAAVLAVIATLLSRECRLSLGYNYLIIKVPFENGKCLYNGTEIASGEHLYAEFPCEDWECIPEGELIIKICERRTQMALDRDCTSLKGAGVFPRCCELVVCQ
uniref:Single domain-containing protein n=1 Tax=Amblyomma maculatum TaxID=34609 RepID=G3MT11_AMBMU